MNMYNKSNIKRYKFRTKSISERVSGCLMLEQVSVIALHSFNNECTEADAFLTLTTAVIFLCIISNLSIMSSSVVCIIALLYVYITNNEYSNQSVTL